MEVFTMKKVLVLAVAALMALSLVACGTDSSSSSAPASTAPSSTSVSEPALLRAPAPLRLPRAPAPAKAPALPRLRNCFFARGEPAGVPFGETARGLFCVMSVRTLRTEKRFFSKKCIRWQHLSPHGNKNPCSKIDKP